MPTGRSRAQWPVSSVAASTLINVGVPAGETGAGHPPSRPAPRGAQLLVPDVSGVGDGDPLQSVRVRLGAILRDLVHRCIPGLSWKTTPPGLHFRGCHRSSTPLAKLIEMGKSRDASLTKDYDHFPSAL
jgi:hypothetical protein